MEIDPQAIYVANVLIIPASEEYREKVATISSLLIGEELPVFTEMIVGESITLSLSEGQVYVRARISRGKLIEFEILKGQRNTKYDSFDLVIVEYTLSKVLSVILPRNRVLSDLLRLLFNVDEKVRIKYSRGNLSIEVSCIGGALIFNNDYIREDGICNNKDTAEVIISKVVGALVENDMY